MPEKLGLCQRRLLVSEAGKGIKWHLAEFQIQTRFSQAPTMFRTPCRDVLETRKFWLTLLFLRESDGWKRKMSILRLPVEMIEARHHACHAWPFPLKPGVFMCCPASTAGQMELRKTRVTVLFVLAGCFVCHLCLSVCCLISVILVCKVTGTVGSLSPISLVWGNVQFWQCFMWRWWRWFSKLTVVYNIETGPMAGFSLCAFSSAVWLFFVSINVYISNILKVQICFFKSPGIEELL